MRRAGAPLRAMLVLSPLPVNRRGQMIFEKRMLGWQDRAGRACDRIQDRYRDRIQDRYRDRIQDRYRGCVFGLRTNQILHRTANKIRRLTYARENFFPKLTSGRCHGTIVFPAPRAATTKESLSGRLRAPQAPSRLIRVTRRPHCREHLISPSGSDYDRRRRRGRDAGIALPHPTSLPSASALRNCGANKFQQRPQHRRLDRNGEGAGVMNPLMFCEYVARCGPIAPSPQCPSYYGPRC